MCLFIKNIYIDQLSKKLNYKMIGFFKIIGNKRNFTRIAALSSYKNSQHFSPKPSLKSLNRPINRSSKQASTTNNY